MYCDKFKCAPSDFGSKNLFFIENSMWRFLHGKRIQIIVNCYLTRGAHRT